MPAQEVSTTNLHNQFHKILKVSVGDIIEAKITQAYSMDPGIPRNFLVLKIYYLGFMELLDIAKGTKHKMDCYSAPVTKVVSRMEMP